MEHDSAMWIAYNKPKIRALPPAGQLFARGEHPSVCYQLSGYVERDDETGMYCITEELAEYVEAKHGIELTGAGQQKLAANTGTGTGADRGRARADGGRAVSESRRDATRQIALDGADATGAAKERAKRSEGEARRAMIDCAQEFQPKHEAAEQDDRQATLDTYTGRVAGARVTRPTGDVYSTPAA